MSKKYSEKYVDSLKKQISSLQRDCQDMRDSRQTSFSRCKKCGRINDSNYCCSYCDDVATEPQQAKAGEEVGDE